MKKTLILLLALIMISQSALCATYTAYPLGDGGVEIVGPKNPDSETSFLIKNSAQTEIIDIAQVGMGEGEFSKIMYIPVVDGNVYNIEIGSETIQFKNVSPEMAFAELQAASAAEFESVLNAYNKIFEADTSLIEPVCDKEAAYVALADKSFTNATTVASEYAGVIADVIAGEITTALSLVAQSKAAEAISNYILQFDVDLDEYSKITDKNLVYDYLNGNTYTKAEFETAFDDAVILTKINEASGESFVSLVRTHQAKIGLDLSPSANIPQAVFNKADKAVSKTYASLKQTFINEISLNKLNTATESNVRSVLEAENSVLHLLDAVGYTALSEELKNSVCKAMARANDFETIQAAKDEFALLIERANTPGATIQPTQRPSSGGGGGYAVSGGTTQAPTSPTAFPFADVKSDFWGYEAINALYNKKIVSGVSATSYEPERLVTREEFIKMLVGTFGLYNPDAQNEFSDIASDDWCASYVASAHEKGLTNGKGDGTFGKGETLTRQDMATLAARCASVAGLVLEKNTQTDFADKAAIAAYALDGVYTLSAAGIINGVGNGRFSPNTGCTRAMAAKVCYELLKIYNGGDL